MPTKSLTMTPMVYPTGDLSQLISKLCRFDFTPLRIRFIVVFAGILSTNLLGLLVVPENTTIELILR
jgi:hypothetical protein